MLLQIAVLLISCSLAAIEAKVRKIEKRAYDQSEPSFKLADAVERLLSNKKRFDLKPLTKTSITKVPAIITEPGSYTVDANLKSTHAGPALIITAQDVFLDFNSHSLTLTADGSCGIEITGAHVTINNPVIKTTYALKSYGILIHDTFDVTIKRPLIERLEAGTQRSCAITVLNSQQIELQDATIAHYGTGMAFEKSSRIQIKQGFITDAVDWAIAASDSSHLTILDTTLEKSGTAMTFYSCDRITMERCSLKEADLGSSVLYSTECAIVETVLTNCSLMGTYTDKIAVNSCTFNNSSLDASYCIYVACQNSTFNGCNLATAIWEADTVLIKNCFFNQQKDVAIYSDTTKATIIENCAINATAENSGGLIATWGGSVNVDNCVLSAETTNPELDAIYLGSCKSAHLENITVDVSPQGTEKTPFPAAIRVFSWGDEPESSSVRIANCIVRGNPKVNIVSTSTSLPNHSLSIENCLVDGGQDGIILSNTQSSSIKNCHVSNCINNGIWIINSLEQDAHGLSTANIVSNCHVVSNGLNGIFIDEKVDKTLIKNNEAYNNGGLGIKANELSHLYDNISYGNENK